MDVDFFEAWAGGINGRHACLAEESDQPGDSGAISHLGAMATVGAAFQGGNAGQGADAVEHVL